MKKNDNLPVIQNFHLDDIAREMMRDSIGSDFLINDNLDLNIDFESSECQLVYKRTLKTISYCSVFFCVEGEIEIDSYTQSYTMHAGDANFCLSGHIGKVKKFSSNARFFLIACKENFYIPPLTATELAALRRELVVHPVAHLTPPQIKACSLLYSMIRNALAKRDDLHYVRRTVQGLTQALLFQVLSAYASGAETSSQYTNARQEEIFSRFIKLVEKHYNKERNIGFYADKLCITPKYLSQLVFKASGVYGSEHIDNYVIAEAKMLIKSQRYSIAQVADQLNFSSQAYFGRYFKKHTGMTPMQFIEKG